MIIDASVVAKWFLKGEEWENESLKIKRLFEDGNLELCALTLILYEVGNIIWKRKDIPADLASKLVLKASGYLKEIIIIPTLETSERALTIARKYNITFYDAVYIAISEQRKEIMVTADKKLYEKLKSNFMVRFISDI